MIGNKEDWLSSFGDFFSDKREVQELFLSAIGVLYIGRRETQTYIDSIRSARYRRAYINH